MKLLKNWGIAFIGLFVMTFLWHNVILSGFYSTNLSQIGRYVDGTLTPLIAFLAIGNVTAALAFALFLPAISKNTMDYVKYGFVLGLAITGSFVLFSHAIFYGWTGALAWADGSYGVLSGMIMGWILSMFNKKA